MAQPVSPHLITKRESEESSAQAADTLHSRHQAARERSRNVAAGILRFADFPPRSLWPRIPGSVAAVIIGVFLFDGVISRGPGLAVLYVVLPLSVVAIEVANCVSRHWHAAALEFALGVWILVLVLIAAAFIRFGAVHGLAAVAITVVLADLLSFSLGILVPRPSPPSQN